MRAFFSIILFWIFLGGCHRQAYPEEKYDIDIAIRNLFGCYKTGDTLIFKSSTNLIDSFIIPGIDSITNNSKGLIMNPRNSKTITVHYRQIPVDKWQERWIETVSNSQQTKVRTQDASLITIVRFPDNNSCEYYFNFENSWCSNSDVPTLFNDTIEINKYKFSSYYKIENCPGHSQRPGGIKTIYSTIKRGLVAFVTNDSVYWTRQN